MLRGVHLPTVIVLALATGAIAEGPEPRAPDLRLVSLVEGFRENSPKRDLSRLDETSIYKHAHSAGADLTKPAHPMLVAQYEKGRLFYVFYKTTENAFGDRPYLIQRIKRVARSWASEDDEEPTETITYQVEVFKTLAGMLKQSDQHYGKYSIRDNHRREVVKTYEVGFGEVRGVCEGTAWPWQAGSLFKMLQGYQEDVGIYYDVEFMASTTWTLAVELAADGTWRVASSEMDFDAPKEMPPRTGGKPRPNDASKKLVLDARNGVDDIRIGEARDEDLVEEFGEPLEDAKVGRGHRNMSFEAAITCNLHPNGLLNTVITRPGFLGKTRKGLKHGDTRAKVMEVMGAPSGQNADAATWSYDGILFAFDGFDRVSRMVIFRRD